MGGCIKPPDRARVKLIPPLPGRAKVNTLFSSFKTHFIYLEMKFSCFKYDFIYLKLDFRCLNLGLKCVVANTDCFQVIETGVYMKQAKVEVYLLELKLCEHSNIDHHITKSFSKEDTIG